MSEKRKTMDQMATMSRDQAIKIVELFHEPMFDYIDYRDMPAVWRVEYEVAGVGFCTDYFITENHRTPPTWWDLPDAGPFDGDSSRPPLAFHSITMVNLRREPDQSWHGVVFSLLD